MANDNTEFFNNLDKFLNEQLPEYLEKGMEKTCIMCEGTAREKCPVDDGQLRQSITHDVRNEDGEIAGYIGTDVEYAPYVHQGTGLYAVNGDGRKQVPWRYQDVKGEWHTTAGQKPQPFLQDAIDENKNNILKQFQNLF